LIESKQRLQDLNGYEEMWGGYEEMWGGYEEMWGGYEEMWWWI